MFLPIPFAVLLGSRRRGETPSDDSDEHRSPRTDEHGVLLPDRRKHRPRREDDLDEVQLRGWSFWAKVMFVHRAKLIAFCAFASGALGYLGATLGIQSRVARLEQVTSATSDRVSTLEDAEPLKFFMLCALYQQNAAGPVPRACDQVLSVPPLNVPMPMRKTR